MSFGSTGVERDATGGHGMLVYLAWLAFRVSLLSYGKSTFLTEVYVFLSENHKFAMSARSPGIAPNEPEACRYTKTITLITNCNKNSNDFGGAVQMEFWWGPGKALGRELHGPGKAFVKELCGDPPEHPETSAILS